MPRNISVPKFTYAPRSYEELMNEANQFIQNYYVTEGAMSQLEQNIGDYQSVMDTFKGKNVDNLDAVKEYMDYVQQVDRLSHELAANGASPEVKRTLMKMQSRYNAVFDPIKEAEAANKKWRDIAQTLDPNDMYDPGQLTYEYLLGKNGDTGEYNYNGTFRHIDANTARKEVETVAKELADQIFTNGNNLPLQHLNNAGMHSLLRYGVDVNDYNAVLRAISKGSDRSSDGLNEKQKLLYGIVENIMGQKDLDSYGLSQDQKDRFWNIAAEGLYSAIGKPSLYTPPEPKETGNGSGNVNGKGNGGKNTDNEESNFSPYRENPTTKANRTTQRERWKMMESYAHNVAGKKSLSENTETRRVQDLLGKNNLILQKSGQNGFIRALDRMFPVLGIDDDLFGVRYYKNRDDIPEYKNMKIGERNSEGNYPVYIWGESLQEAFNEITGMGSNQETTMSYNKVVENNTEQQGIFGTLKQQKKAKIVEEDGDTGGWKASDYHGKEFFNDVPTDEKKSHALTSKMITGYDTTPQGIVVHFSDNNGEKVHVLYDNENNPYVGRTSYYVNYANAVGLAQQQMDYFLNHKLDDNDFKFNTIDNLIETYGNGNMPIGYREGDMPLTNEYGSIIITTNGIPVYNQIQLPGNKSIYNITFEKIPSLLKEIKKISNKTEREKVKQQLLNLIRRELDNNKRLHDDEAYNIFRTGKPQEQTDKP